MSRRCERLKGAAFTEPHPHPSIVVVEGLNLDKPTTLTFCWFQFAIHKKGQFENHATEDYSALQYFKICWICFESEKKTLSAHFRPLESGFLAFSHFIGLSLILCTSENSSFEKRRNITTKCIKQFQIWFWILKFSIFVCFLVCLYLTFCWLRKRKMAQLWFQKLFWNQDCYVASNLLVKIAILIFPLCSNVQGHGEEISTKEEQGLEGASGNYLPSQNFGIPPIFSLQNCTLNRKPNL